MFAQAYLSETLGSLRYTKPDYNVATYVPKYSQMHPTQSHTKLLKCVTYKVKCAPSEAVLSEEIMLTIHKNI